MHASFEPKEVPFFAVSNEPLLHAQIRLCAHCKQGSLGLQKPEESFVIFLDELRAKELTQGKMTSACNDKNEAMVRARSVLRVPQTLT